MIVKALVNTFPPPDMSYVVNKLLRFMHEPTDEHLKAVKRILRYLKATATSGLHILHNSDYNFSIYADVDWAGDPNDRISTSGYALFIGRNPVSWSL